MPSRRLPDVLATFTLSLVTSLIASFVTFASADDGPVPWSVVPVNTRAVAVVPNMRRFSDELDQMARLMRLVQPGVLEYAMRTSAISTGLDQSGALIWVYGPPTNGATPIAYLLPASDGAQLRRGIRAIPDGDVHRATIGNREFLVDDVESFVGFITPDDASRSWLRVCRDTPGDGHRAFGRLNTYLSSQDIGFVISPQGLAEGISASLPFSSGAYVTPSLLNEIASDFSQARDITATAGGIDINPMAGVTVSLASLLDVLGEVSDWTETMTLDRDALLQDVPFGEICALFATSLPEAATSELMQRIRDINLRSHPKGRLLSQRLDLSTLRGITATVRPTEEDEHWTSTIQLQVHCDNPNRALPAIRDWVSDYLTDLNNEPQITLQEQVVDGQRFLTMDLHPEDIPTTVALCILNERSLLISGGGIDQLQRELAKRSQPGRIQDIPKISTACQMLRPDSQTIALVDVYQSAIWLLDVYLEYGNVANIREGRTVEDETTMSILIHQYAAVFRDAPPLALGNYFGPSTTMTQLALANDVLKSIGQVVRFTFPMYGAAPPR
ncbi:MAG: hypothetical protein KDA75_15775 [Planctomycetaceae bacterium]|nr:hypothetical protein [Planctomycetaceae bacterium]